MKRSTTIISLVAMTTGLSHAALIMSDSFDDGGRTNGTDSAAHHSKPCVPNTRRFAR